MMNTKRQLIAIVAGLWSSVSLSAQIDVDHVISIGRNALYFNDYVVSIGYFNRAIDTRPWMAEPYFYRSIAKISLDDYEGAEIDASLCIERNPYISRSYLVRGIARQNQQQYETALSDYRQGLLLSPNDVNMRFNLAVVQMKLKQYQDAELSIDTLMRYANKHKEVYALRAGLALERQDTIQALVRIEEAIRQDSTLTMPYRLKASIAASREDWTNGVANLTKAIELGEQEADLYVKRGIMHYQINNLRGAMADYSKALDIEPSNKISLHNRAILRSMVGERTEAFKDWDRLVQLEPSNYIARYNRAILAIETGQSLRIALSDLDVVLKQYPSFSEGFIQRSILRRRLGDKRGGEQDYWHALDLQRNKSYDSKARAASLSNKRRQTRELADSSIDKYNLLVEATPSNTPEATRYTSLERGRVQDRDVAVESKPVFYLTYFMPLDAKGRLLDNTTYYYAQLLETYNNMSRDTRHKIALQCLPITLNQEQIAELNTMLSLPEQVSSTHYYLRRGIIHSLLQDYQQAIADYTRALELDPQNKLALFVRSVASMRYRQAESSRNNSAEGSSIETELLRGQANQTIASSSKLNIKPLDTMPTALKDLSQLVLIEPSFAYAYYNRAHIYAQIGESDKALQDYNRAVELMPRLAEAYYNRGLLLLSLGRTREGISDLSRSGELGIYQAYNIIKRMNK